MRSSLPQQSFTSFKKAAGGSGKYIQEISLAATIWHSLATDQQKDESVRLRVVTYNIHGCIGTDGRREPDRILEALVRIDADVVMLQELSNTQTGARREPMLDWLGTKLNMRPYLGSTLIREDSAYGNACLTRMTPHSVHLHDLAVANREPRGLIELTLATPGSLVRLLVTHLGLRRGERREQYRRIAAILERDPDSITVLGGDFNDFGLPRSIRHARGAAPSTRTRPSFPSRIPLLPFDRIHVWPEHRLRELSIVRDSISRNASDHLPLLAEIDIGADENATHRPRDSRTTH